MPETSALVLRGLFAVFIGQIFSDFSFHLAVVRVDGRTQGGFGGTALSEAFQDSTYVTHPVCVIYVLHRRQRFVVGNDGLKRRELHEAAFKGVIGNLLLRLEQLCQPPPTRRERLRLQSLRHTFIQPLRTAST